ncbi:MAG: hypothetical protein WD696_15925 [Bryobacteraceae bacterium]
MTNLTGLSKGSLLAGTHGRQRQGDPGAAGQHADAKDLLLIIE